jgi:Family of unknown function (DUF6157)
VKTALKQHTTNEANLFIAIAPDSPATHSMAPPLRVPPSIVQLSFEMLKKVPYHLTSDDIIFAVWSLRNNVAPGALDAARKTFFSKGQPCFRSSDLCKKYGWGIHFDAEAKGALVGVETAAYRAFMKGHGVDTVKQAMRSARASR